MEVKINIWNGNVGFFTFISQQMHGSVYIVLHHRLPLDSLNVDNKSARKWLKDIVNYQKHETEKSSSTCLHEDSEK